MPGDNDEVKVTFILSQWLSEKLAILMKNRGFLNRSEYLRDLLRNEIERQKIHIASLTPSKRTLDDSK